MTGLEVLCLGCRVLGLGLLFGVSGGGRQLLRPGYSVGVRTGRAFGFGLIGNSVSLNPQNPNEAKPNTHMKPLCLKLSLREP